MQCVNCERVIEGGEALGGGGDKQVKTRPMSKSTGCQFNWLKNRLKNCLKNHLRFPILGKYQKWVVYSARR